MPLSALSVLVVAQSSSEIAEGLMNNPVFNLIRFQNFRTLALTPVLCSFYSLYSSYNRYFYCVVYVLSGVRQIKISKNKPDISIIQSGNFLLRFKLRPRISC